MIYVDCFIEYVDNYIEKHLTFIF